jgi:hypothetical protein
MNIEELIAEGLFFRAGSGNKQYRTCLEGKTTPIAKAPLPQQITDSFLNGEYETYRVVEPLVLYRTFGVSPYSENGASINGSYATTEFAESKIDVKIRTALDPTWKNPKLYEIRIIVPVGVEINVGKVAPVTLRSGTVLEGGAIQVLLPKDWPLSWIDGWREISSKPLSNYPVYVPVAEGSVPTFMKYEKPNDH